MTGSGRFLSEFVSLTAIILCFSLISCNKNEAIDLNSNLNIANDIVLSQRPLIQSFRMLVRAVADTGLQQTHQAFFDGASVSYNPGSNRYSFFYQGAACPDSVIRSGRIDADLFGDFYTQGTKVKITFTNYTEDFMPIAATDSLINEGISGSHVVFANIIANGIIIKDTVGTIHFNARLKYWLPSAPAGIGNQALINIGGTQSGTSSKGFIFFSEIFDTLAYPVFSDACAWVRKGTIRFALSEGSAPEGAIRFPALTSCNDSVYYDFGATTYQWRMKPKYMSH